MADRYPGGVISKTPPTVTGPTGGEGGSASGVWTLDTVLEYEKAGGWPKPLLPRELYGWGSNANGRLGDGTVVDRSSPVQIGASTTWSSVSSGTGSGAHAIKLDGTLWGWGANNNGQVGDNTGVSRSSPVQIGALTNWYQVSSGFCVAAIKTDGTLWTWGLNFYGSLGINQGALSYNSSPVQVGALTTWAQVSANFGSRMAAIKTDGTLWAWGRNNNGQVGDGTTVHRSSPVQVGALTNWSYVSVSGYHTHATKTDGTFWSWGVAGQGRLGDNQALSARSSPIQIGSLTNWDKPACGNRHTIAQKTDGTLWGWGENTYGRIGDGTTANRSSPVQIGALTDWLQAVGGYQHSVGVKTDGTLWAWGRNSSGELGIGNTINLSSPAQTGAQTNWLQASGGISHTVAITKG